MALAGLPRFGVVLRVLLSLVLLVVLLNVVLFIALNNLHQSDTNTTTTASDTIVSDQACPVYTTVAQYRDAYNTDPSRSGDIESTTTARKQWWSRSGLSLLSGLSAPATRKLYHTILPRCLLRSDKHYTHLNACERARVAYAARQAAKQYARERGDIGVRMYSALFDFWRTWMARGLRAAWALPNTDKYAKHFWKYSARKVLTNMKKEGKLRTDGDVDGDVKVMQECLNIEARPDMLWNSDKCEMVCETILQSAFRTNEQVNEVVENLALLEKQASQFANDARKSMNSLRGNDETRKNEL